MSRRPASVRGEGAFSRHRSGVQRHKSSGGLWPPEPAPLARRRPGYSSSGCTPAEPDSASPGNTKLACHLALSIRSVRGPERQNSFLTQRRRIDE